jgi:amidase
MARTVADAAAVLGPLTGVDPRDPYTDASKGNSHTDYSRFVDANGLDGARIGVARNLFGFSPEADAVVEGALALMSSAGAVIVDPTNLDTASEIGGPEFEVLLYEFKTDIALYLETRTPGSPTDLAGLIAFNNANADAELKWFGQGIFELSETKGPLTDQAYLDALETGQRLAREEGLDKVMQDNNLDAIVAPTGSPAWPTDLINGDHFLGGSSSMAAVAGYPLVTVTAGYSFRLPVGITFMGRAWSEPTLIKLASGFEAVRGPRQRPTMKKRIRAGWSAA